MRKTWQFWALCLASTSLVTVWADTTRVNSRLGERDLENAQPGPHSHSLDEDGALALLERT
jgi:hypothetical protein